MALDDIKVTHPATKPERFPRIRDYKRFGENFDSIFRKSKTWKPSDTEVEKEND